MTRKKTIVVVGSLGCGKSYLSSVFINNQYPENSFYSFCDEFATEIVVDGEQIELVIWDTSGLDDYDQLRHRCYAYADVVLMCYSINSPDSLKEILEIWIREVRHFCPKVPIVLVGNKKDLRTDELTIQNLMKVKEEPVRYEEGKQMADEIGAYCYLECSAKTKDGIREVFEMVTRAAMQSKRARNRPHCSLF